MDSRIMMTIRGKTQSLRFEAGGNPQPLLNSSLTDWAGLPLEVHHIRMAEPDSLSGPVENEHGIGVIMNGQVDIVLRKDKRDTRFSYVPGTKFSLSGNYPVHVVKIEGSAEVAAVHLRKEYLARLLLDSVPTSFGITDPFGRDETVFSLVRAMRDEVAAGAPTGRLYSESLSMALLSYMMEHVPPSCFRVRGRFTDAQCRRLQKYIRDRLHEELSLTELASVAKISTRHFSTLFREAFGTTPHQYVLNNRLAEGARALANESQDIADLALRLGFSSQSHFASAFRRSFGATPRKYAAEKRKSLSGFGS
jgi:AraC family transcriptional regulator